MKKLLLLPLAIVALVPGCKKSDPTAEGAAASAVPAPPTDPGAVAAAAVAALKDFEGEIGILVKSKKERKPVPPITVTVKQAKLRFDVPEGVEGAPPLGKQVHAILDAPAKKVYMIVDEQKMVMTLDIEKLGDQMKGFTSRGVPSHPDTDAPPKVTKTGQMDTVAGYKCENWNIVRPNGERAQLCVSGENASFFELPTIGLPGDSAWAKELFDGHHLPLRMISYDATGAEESRLEITKIEKKPVSDALFAIPPGYRTMDLADMMHGMMGGLLAAGLAGSAAPSGLPPGFALPPGVQLPPGVVLPPNLKLPQGMQLPPNAAEMMKQMQERARAAGITPPPAPAK